MLACVAEADAEKFMSTGAVQSFPVLVSGEYSLDVLGASGGTSTAGRLVAAWAPRFPATFPSPLARL